MLMLSRRVLKLLIVLNWLFVAFFAAMLAVLASPVYDTALRALTDSHGPAQAAMTLRMLAWLMALGILTGLAAHILFHRMLAIVGTAIAGDPFTRENAARLRTVGWALLAIQIIDLGFGVISLSVDNLVDEPFGWNVSVGGWIAALMVFVLARVFEQGSRMRDELAMTV